MRWPAGGRLVLRPSGRARYNHKASGRRGGGIEVVKVLPGRVMS